MVNGGDFTIRAMLQALQTGSVSSRELTQAALERADRLEPRLHAFITLTPDLALQMADAADRRWLAVFATTNLSFHLSTAYGILRARGVPLGKIDLFAGGL